MSNIHIKSYQKYWNSLQSKVNSYRSSLINLDYAFAYPYFIYCNVVWGENDTTTLDRLILLQNKLICILTCSPFWAHTEPLFFANRILNVTDINDYTIGSFMYEYIYGNVTDIFNNYSQRNRDIHGLDIRNADDLHVPYGRLDMRKFSIKIAGQICGNRSHCILKIPHLSIFLKKYETLSLDRKLTCRSHIVLQKWLHWKFYLMKFYDVYQDNKVWHVCSLHLY